MAEQRRLTGFRRPNGAVGTRNYVAILPVDDLSNAAAEGVAALVPGTLALPHAFGRLQFGDDLELTFRTLIGIGSNPNIAAVVVIGVEPNWTGRVVDGIAATGKPVILSTGMSTLEEIDATVEILGTSRLVILHATSTYPLPPEEANLRTILTLRERYGVPVGYSGHERGLQISLAAVTLGAVMLERHITLDRTMWGSDQPASLEPAGLEHLVRDVRIIETALGDGVKRIYPGELAPKARLRRVTV